MQRRQPRAGEDNPVQSAPAAVDGAKLPVRANRRIQRGKQLNAGQFGFGLVIVDVEITDRVDFRGIARLAGTQDDAHVSQLERLADVTHQVQAGVGLHRDHVEQDNCNFYFVLEHFPRLGERVGMHELQRPMFHLKVAQGERGGRVHVLIVVDDHHAPDLGFDACCGRRGMLFQVYQVVLVIFLEMIQGHT